MPKLEVLTGEIGSVPRAACLTLKGTLESDSLPELQRRIEQLEKKDVLFVAVDSRELDYVNRAGFMVLVNLSKRLHEQDGCLVLVGLTPKVERIFEMLQLRSFIQVMPDMASADEHFVEGEFHTAISEDKMTEGSPGPEDTHSDFDFDEALKLAGQEGEPGELPEGLPGGLPEDLDADLPEDLEADLPDALDEALAQEPADAALMPEPQLDGELQEETGEHFPVFLLCDHCSANLKAEEPGAYRCPRCGDLFRVQSDGTPEFVATRSPRAIRMELPSSTECIRGLVEFLGAVAKPALGDSQMVADLQRALASICRHVRDTAYEGNTSQSYQLIIVPGPGRMVIQVADSGLRVEPAAIRAEVRRLVDLVEVKARLGGGNFYKLVKEAPPTDEEE